MGQEQRDRQTEWGTAHGLRSYDGSWQVCPQNVIQKQCRMGYAENRDVFGEEVVCVCQHSKVRAVSDHIRRWTLETESGREQVVTYEPYSPSDEAIEGLRSVVGPMGIIVWETWQWAWTEGTEILVLTRNNVTAADLKL